MTTKNNKPIFQSVQLNRKSINSINQTIS